MSPPKIMFDDGSRIMQEYDAQQATTSSSSHDGSQSPSTTPSTTSSARGTVAIEVYYEVDRVANDVVDKLDWSENTTSRGQLRRKIMAIVENNYGAVKDDDGSNDKIIDAADQQQKVDTATNIIDEDGFLCRIALQFPDELLADAPEVSWLMETAIVNAYKKKLMGPPTLLQNNNSSSLDTATQSLINHHLSQTPLLFILGDTTYGSCCPDEVSANHLNANLIVHYGYACLAPTESVPVVYAFGVSGVSGVGGVGDTVGAVVVGEEGGGESGSNNEHFWKDCVHLVSNEADKEERNVNEEQLDETLAQMKLAGSENGEPCKKLLILYEVKYHHAMNELKMEFEKTGQFQIVLGVIPKQQLSVGRLHDQHKNNGECGTGGCGGGGGGCETDAVASNTCCASNEVAQSTQSCCEKDGAKDGSSCCAEAGGSDAGNNISETKTVENAKDKEDTTDTQHRIEEEHYIPRTIGGLEIPDDLDLSQYTVLYIGDDLNIESQNGKARTRLLHILLRCDAPDGPPSLWCYSPAKNHLNTDVLNSPLSSTNSTSLSTALSRTLRRRYFLINKAKLATTIAILIGTTSNSYSFRRLLARTRHRIQSTGRTAYTFAVGKLSTSASKLANFAEIDCFVLIACGESIAKFWQMEREELLVPVLTPLELDVALGFREWDGRYSCDFGDLIRWDKEDGIEDDVRGDGHDDHLTNTIKDAGNNEDGDGNSSSDDEPFFSMISGKYEQSKATATSKQNNAMNNNGANLEALPGQGKIIEYRSEAAEFLKKREYRGLEANVGGTEAKAAVMGQVGIAS
ncbi:hypothetical protein ACHAXR_003515, partial [Thalassiosira sp. AJA248-18]